MTIVITSNFDGGNILVRQIYLDGADLEIVSDPFCGLYQWFSFRISGGRDRALTLRIGNCGGSAYPEGWPGYQARVSDDGLNWRCTPTTYVDDILTLQVKPASDLLHVAYFAPYDSRRHAELIDRSATSPGVKRSVLGLSLQARPVDALTLGSGALKVWMIARQHPGETMAQWWMEGVIEKLTVEDDAAAARLRERATIHIVPNMNPDGSAHGHLRTNAAGCNLNREWQSPTLARSPEVFHVLKAMDLTGVDLVFDVHGHEVAMGPFVAISAGGVGERRRNRAFYKRFGSRLAAVNAAFRNEPDYPELTDLSMAVPQIALRFGAIAMVLEMPFKDSCVSPDPEFGWSPERSKALANDIIDVLTEMIDDVAQVRCGDGKLV